MTGRSEPAGVRETISIASAGAAGSGEGATRVTVSKFTDAAADDAGSNASASAASRAAAAAKKRSLGGEGARTAQ